MDMKILNKENEHEIGFDIDCLPAWATVIFMDSRGDWVVSQWQDDIGREIEELNSIYFHIEGGYMDIPEEYEPKKFEGGWKDSLYKIERK